MIGHSMGAATSAYLAAHYAGLVRCILLEDPPWHGKHEAAPEADRVAMAERWRQEVIERTGMSLETVVALGREQRPMWSQEEFGAWAESKLQVSPNALDYARYPSTHWTAYMDKILCPVLLLIGDVEHGAIVSQATAQEVASLNPRVQIAHIAGAGHSIRREQFDAYVDAVSSFLADVYS
jgi:pimeloyl-ACP methyl ester carboxylesterase